MKSWQKALALALGLPSTIIGVFFALQELVKIDLITQAQAQAGLVLVVVIILIKMVMSTWKKK